MLGVALAPKITLVSSGGQKADWGKPTNHMPGTLPSLSAGKAWQLPGTDGGEQHSPLLLYVAAASAQQGENPPFLDGRVEVRRLVLTPCLSAEQSVLSFLFLTICAK